MIINLKRLLREWRKNMDLHEEKKLEMKLEEKLKVAFEELGRRYYSSNINNGTFEGEYQDLLEEISNIFSQKNMLEDKVLAKQGKRRCRKCQTIVTMESRFCNMCGEKLEELLVSVEKEKECIEVKKCSECGTELEADAIFCPNCGQKNA